MGNSPQMPSVMATMFSVVGNILNYEITVGSWSFTLWKAIITGTIIWSIVEVIKVSVRADHH